MKQTNKLRFVERTVKVFINEDTYTTRKLRILQQWWEEDGGDYDGLGEWRDVPIEVEE